MRAGLLALLLLVPLVAFGQAYSYTDQPFMYISLPNASATVYEIADTFTGADGTELSTHTTTTGGYAWLKSDTAWTIYGNVITNTVDGQSHYSRYWVDHTMSSADYTATINLIPKTFSTSCYFGLGIRDDGLGTGLESAYFIWWNRGSALAQLWKKVAGTKTQLGTDYSFVEGATVTLLISASGTTITAKVNGTDIPGTPIVDNAVAGPGTVGIGGGYLDNGNSYTITADDLTVSVP